MTTVKARAKPLLPFIGIPIVCAALLLLRSGRSDPFTLLLHIMIAIFGYIGMVTDAKSKLIPNGLILAMLAAWVFAVVPKLFVDPSAAAAVLRGSVFGFIAGGGMFLLVYLVSRKGLGGGDVKFMAATGLFVGFDGAVPVMLYGTVLAALAGIALILLKKIGRKDSIPLAPFLYAGILIYVFMQ